MRLPTWIQWLCCRRGGLNIAHALEPDDVDLNHSSPGPLNHSSPGTSPVGSPLANVSNQVSESTTKPIKKQKLSTTAADNAPSPSSEYKENEDNDIDDDDDDNDIADDAPSEWPPIITPTINNDFVVQPVPPLDRQRQIKAACREELELLPDYDKDKHHCDFLADFVDGIPPGLNLHLSGALCDTPDVLGGATLTGKGGYRFPDNVRKRFDEVASVRNLILYASGLPPMLINSGGPINNIIITNINEKCDATWNENGTFNCKPGTVAQAEHMARKLSIVAKANWKLGGMNMYLGLGGVSNGLKKAAEELDSRYFAMISAVSAHVSNYAYARAGYRDEDNKYTVRAQTMKISKMLEAQSYAIKNVHAKHIKDLNRNVSTNIHTSTVNFHRHQPMKDSPFEVLANEPSMRFVSDKWNSLDEEQWTTKHQRVMSDIGKTLYNTYKRGPTVDARSKGGKASWNKAKENNVGLSDLMIFLKQMFGEEVLMLTQEELELVMSEQGKKARAAKEAKYSSEEQGQQVKMGYAKKKKTKEDELIASGEYVKWECVHTVKGQKCPKYWLESKADYDARFPTMKVTVSSSNMPKGGNKGSKWPACASSPSLCKKTSNRVAEKHWKVTFVSDGGTQLLFDPEPLFDGKPKHNTKSVASFFASVGKKRKP